MVDPLLVGVYIVVAGLLITGPAGSLLPFLPGTPLIPAAALLHALMTDFSPIGAGRLLMLAGLATLPTFWSMSRVPSGRKKVGGSAWAVIGAVIGAPADHVGGTFTFDTGTTAFQLSGFTSFANLLAGDLFGGLAVGLDSSTLACSITASSSIPTARTRVGSSGISGTSR